MAAAPAVDVFKKIYIYLNNSNRAFVSVEPAGEQHLSLNYAAISDDLRSATASKSIDFMSLDALRLPYPFQGRRNDFRT